MIIKKSINLNTLAFSAITDDTRDLANLESSQTLFVKTKQNATFIAPLINNKTLDSTQVIESSDLGKILLDNNAKIPRIVGISGTNGKTTTAAIIYSILLDLDYNAALLGTRGLFINDREIKPKGLTTPSVLELYENLSLAQAHNCDYFIMEVSSHAIEQERIAGLNFALKILTNITSDHLDYHKSIEAYRAVKNSFFSHSASGNICLINADEPYAMLNKTRIEGIEAYYYGIESKRGMCVNAYSLESGIDAHISLPSAFSNGAFGADSTNHIESSTNSAESATLYSHLFGKYNLYNILAAIGAVKLLTNAKLESITAALTHFGGVSGRMEVINEKPLVIVDFAHTHDGMKQVFEAFRHRDIAVVFGAGGNRDRLKRPLMGQCAYKYAKRLYITSDNPRDENPESIISDIIAGLGEYDTSRVVVESDRKQAILQALAGLKDSEVLLILGKGDEEYQIIGDKKLSFSDKAIVREYFGLKG